MSEAQRDFAMKRIWAVAGAITVVVAYVIMNGIVRIEIAGEEDEEEKDGYANVKEERLMDLEEVLEEVLEEDDE